MFIALLLLFALTFVPSAQADTSSSSDHKDFKSYGSCHVTTQVDMFTDAETHLFVCQESTRTDETSIGIMAGGGLLGVGLSKGAMLYIDDTIRVAVRIDKGPLHRRTAEWSKTHEAIILDNAFALTLLNELAQGQRIAIQVGDERGNIRLEGSVAAVQDFRQRADLSALDQP